MRMGLNILRKEKEGEKIEGGNEEREVNIRSNERNNLT